MAMVDIYLPLTIIFTQNAGKEQSDRERERATGEDQSFTRDKGCVYVKPSYQQLISINNSIIRISVSTL